MTKTITIYEGPSAETAAQVFQGLMQAKLEATLANTGRILFSTFKGSEIHTLAARPKSEHFLPATWKVELYQEDDNG